VWVLELLTCTWVWMCLGAAPTAADRCADLGGRMLISLQSESPRSVLV
jgi:TRAP-type C4-dicarboxylate transport system permease small subunit